MSHTGYIEILVYPSSYIMLPFICGGLKEHASRNVTVFLAFCCLFPEEAQTQPCHLLAPSR